MKEESKYYVPSIEEYHVGFEYEVNEDPRGYEWSKIVVEDWHDCKYAMKIDDDGEYRVKYLDRELIEELGWIYSSNNCFDFKERWCLSWYPEMKRVEIHDEQSEFVFAGILKNKSELRKIMQYLQII